MEIHDWDGFKEIGQRDIPSMELFEREVDYEKPTQNKERIHGNGSV